MKKPKKSKRTINSWKYEIISPSIINWYYDCFHSSLQPTNISSKRGWFRIWLTTSVLIKNSPIRLSISFVNDPRDYMIMHLYPEVLLEFTSFPYHISIVYNCFVRVEYPYREGFSSFFAKMVANIYFYLSDIPNNSMKM
jgi:hypothetical protein